MLGGLSTVHKVALGVALPVTAALLWFLLSRNEEDEEDDIPPQRVVTSRQTVIEVKVPREAVGAVIGSKGAQIKQIQDVSGARVNFKDEGGDGDERVVVVRGTHDRAQQAELLIRKVIAEQPTIETQTIYVPQIAMGRIIGRNGDNIRSMSRTSKAKITADRSDERRQDKMVKIDIRGSVTAIANAKDQIMTKVEEEKASRAKVELAVSNRSQRGRRDRPNRDDDTHKQPESDDHNAVSTKQLKRPSQLPASWPEQQDYLRVFVSAVQHPGHFWVQLINSHTTHLDRLLDDMTRYYDCPDSKQASQLESIREGELIAAPYLQEGGDDKFYRARIEEVLDDGRHLDLYYLDYGDNDQVPTHSCYSLRSDFLSLPFQAYECCLAGVKPKDGDEWSEEAIVAFEDLVHVSKWKEVHARTSSYLELPGTATWPCLEIIDTHAQQDVNVAAELVRLGHAVWDVSVADTGPADAADADDQKTTCCDVLPSTQLLQPETQPHQKHQHRDNINDKISTSLLEQNDTVPSVPLYQTEDTPQQISLDSHDSVPHGESCETDSQSGVVLKETVTCVANSYKDNMIQEEDTGVLSQKADSLSPVVESAKSSSYNDSDHVEEASVVKYIVEEEGSPKNTRKRVIYVNASDLEGVPNIRKRTPTSSSASKEQFDETITNDLQTDISEIKQMATNVCELTIPKEVNFTESSNAISSSSSKSPQKRKWDEVSQGITRKESPYESDKSSKSVESTETGSSVDTPSKIVVKDMIESLSAPYSSVPTNVQSVSKMESSNDGDIEEIEGKDSEGVDIPVQRLKGHLRKRKHKETTLEDTSDEELHVETREKEVSDGVGVDGNVMKEIPLPVIGSGSSGSDSDIESDSLIEVSGRESLSQKVGLEDDKKVDDIESDLSDELEEDSLEEEDEIVSMGQLLVKVHEARRQDSQEGVRSLHKQAVNDSALQGNGAVEVCASGKSEASRKEAVPQSTIDSDASKHVPMQDNVEDTKPMMIAPVNNDNSAENSSSIVNTDSAKFVEIGQSDNSTVAAQANVAAVINEKKDEDVCEIMNDIPLAHSSPVVSHDSNDNITNGPEPMLCLINKSDGKSETSEVAQSLFEPMIDDKKNEDETKVSCNKAADTAPLSDAHIRDSLEDSSVSVDIDRLVSPKDVNVVHSERVDIQETLDDKSTEESYVKKEPSDIPTKEAKSSDLQSIKSDNKSQDITSQVKAKPQRPSLLPTLSSHPDKSLPSSPKATPTSPSRATTSSKDMANIELPQTQTSKIPKLSSTSQSSSKPKPLGKSVSPPRSVSMPDLNAQISASPAKASVSTSLVPASSATSKMSLPYLQKTKSKSLPGSPATVRKDKKSPVKRTVTTCSAASLHPLDGFLRHPAKPSSMVGSRMNELRKTFMPKKRIVMETAKVVEKVREYEEIIEIISPPTSPATGRKQLQLPEEEFEDVVFSNIGTETDRVNASGSNSSLDSSMDEDKKVSLSDEITPHDGMKSDQLVQKVENIVDDSCEIPNRENENGSKECSLEEDSLEQQQLPVTDDYTVKDKQKEQDSSSKDLQDQNELQSTCKVEEKEICEEPSYEADSMDFTRDSLERDIPCIPSQLSVSTDQINQSLTPAENSSLPYSGSHVHNAETDIKPSFRMNSQDSDKQDSLLDYPSPGSDILNAIFTPDDESCSNQPSKFSPPLQFEGEGDQDSGLENQSPMSETESGGFILNPKGQGLAALQEIPTEENSDDLHDSLDEDELTDLPNISMPVNVPTVALLKEQEQDQGSLQSLHSFDEKDMIGDVPECANPVPLKRCGLGLYSHENTDSADEEVLALMKLGASSEVKAKDEEDKDDTSSLSDSLEDNSEIEESDLSDARSFVDNVFFGGSKSGSKSSSLSSLNERHQDDLLLFKPKFGSRSSLERDDSDDVITTGFALKHRKQELLAPRSHEISHIATGFSVGFKQRLSPIPAVETLSPTPTDPKPLLEKVTSIQEKEDAAVRQIFQNASKVNKEYLDLPVSWPDRFADVEFEPEDNMHCELASSRGDNMDVMKGLDSSNLPLYDIYFGMADIDQHEEEINLEQIDDISYLAPKESKVQSHDENGLQDFSKVTLNQPEVLVRSGNKDSSSEGDSNFRKRNDTGIVKSDIQDSSNSIEDGVSRAGKTKILRKRRRSTDNLSDDEIEVENKDNVSYVRKRPPRRKMQIAEAEGGQTTGVDSSIYQQTTDEESKSVFTSTVNESHPEESAKQDMSLSDDSLNDSLDEMINLKPRGLEYKDLLNSSPSLSQDSLNESTDSYEQITGSGYVDKLYGHSIVPIADEEVLSSYTEDSIEDHLSREEDLKEEIVKIEDKTAVAVNESSDSIVTADDSTESSGKIDDIKELKADETVKSDRSEMERETDVNAQGIVHDSSETGDEQMGAEAISSNEDNSASRVVQVNEKEENEIELPDDNNADKAVTRDSCSSQAISEHTSDSSKSSKAESSDANRSMLAEMEDFDDLGESDEEVSTDDAVTGHEYVTFIPDSQLEKHERVVIDKLSKMESSVKTQDDSQPDKEVELESTLIEDVAQLSSSPTTDSSSTDNDNKPTIKLYMSKPDNNSKPPSKSSLKKSGLKKKKNGKVRFKEGAQVKHIERICRVSDEEEEVEHVQPLMSLAQAQEEFPFIDSGDSDSDDSSEGEGASYDVVEPRSGRRQDRRDVLRGIDEEEEELHAL